jgi:hypothetical protein
MKNNLYYTEKIVEKVLRQHIDTRSDDFILIYRVFKEINENVVIRLPFFEVMLNHKEYGLPAIASIMRARRKVYERYPYLNPKKIKELRKEKEEEYKEYSKS